MKEKNTTSDQIYEELKKEIMFLELLPGQAINEEETAKRFKVSRTPVRDAFKRLEIEGLIKIHRGYGTFVSLIDIDELDDIMYIREKLETSVVKDIGAITRSQKINLKLLLDKQKELLEQDLDDFTLSKKFLALDNELHEAIFKLASKINIWKRISNDRPHYNRLRMLSNLYRKSEIEKLYKEHVKIVDCIIKQEYDQVDNYYREHLYRGMHNLTEIVKQNIEYFSNT